MLIIAIYADLGIMVLLNCQIMFEALERFRNNWPGGGGRPNASVTDEGRWAANETQAFAAKAV